MQRIIIYNDEREGRVSREVYGLSESLEIIRKLNQDPKYNHIYFDAIEELDEDWGKDGLVREHWKIEQEILKAESLTHRSDLAPELDV